VEAPCAAALERPRPVTAPSKKPGSIAAVDAIVQSGQRPAGDILIAAVADEEVASIGMMDVLARYRTDGAIVTEPTSLRLCLAHKGFIWYQVTTHGRAAHGSRPDLGIDANAHMGRVLGGIETLGRALAERQPHHPLVGHGSLHAATLSGGSGLSTYAAECRLGIERRTIPGETRAVATAEIQAILDTLHRADPAFRAELEVTLAREPFEARHDSPLANALAGAAKPVIGAVPRVGDTAWMDAALASAAGIDTIVFGPHGEGAHAAVEWVDLSSVRQCAHVLALTALDYCAA
jgi:acetylornithine deacetylase